MKALFRTLTDRGKAPRPLRIAIVGMASENCTFSLARTHRKDFTILRGDDMVARYPFLRSAWFSADSAFKFMPGFFAKALPGGVIGSVDYESLKEELLATLKSLSDIDAVYLDLHGAMKVEGLEDAELDLIKGIRGLVGETCLLGASMDLHGNVSQQLVEAVDLFTAYRTAPHLDELVTREKACRMIVETLRHGWDPVRAFVSIPVLLPGEMTSTLAEPGRSLYGGLPEVEWQADVLDVSLWVGYVWADEKRAHASVVVTGLSAERVKEAAEEIALRYWNARKEFAFGVRSGTIKECVDWVMVESVSPVLISDSGDNPTAGGVGDLSSALPALDSQPLIREGRKKALCVGIWDVDSVEKAFAAGQGARLMLEIGRSADPTSGGSFQLEGTVARLFEGDPVAGRQVVFRKGGLTVVLTEKRKPFHELGDFRQLGLEPTAADLIVVKMGYLVPELDEIAKERYLALTPGAVNQDLSAVTYKEIERPMFPFDPGMEWTPQAVVTKRGGSSRRPHH